jgi:hypothetical protein
MKTFTTRVLVALGAAALALSVSSTSEASFDVPVASDCMSALANITGEKNQLIALEQLGPIDVSDIKIVYLEDILNGSELLNVSNTLNKLSVILALVSLHNTLNNIDVIENSDVLTFADFLNGNDVDVSDVVGVNVLNDGNVLVFCH